MSSQPDFALPQTSRGAVAATFLLIDCLLLSACGDGGGGIASAGPPPAPGTTTIGAPLAPSPALVSGSYAVRGVMQTHDPSNGQTSAAAIGPNVLAIAVDAATNRYTLTFDQATIPVTGTNGTLAFGVSDPRYGHAYSQPSYTNGVYSGQYDGEGTFGSAILRGSDTGRPQDNQFLSDVGLRHVSLGEWDWWTPNPPGGSAPTAGGLVAFVYGDRTPAAALPASGTATYAATHYLGAGYDQDFEIALTADFAARSMQGKVGYYSLASSGGTDAWRTDLGGSGPIAASGDFAMTLNGTRQAGKLDCCGNFTASGAPAPASPGSVAGAFYGPDASEVGGTMLLPDPAGGTFTISFAGAKK